MRLPRPTLEMESPLRFAPEDLLGTCVPVDSLPRPSSEAFERRLDLFAAEDASGLSGTLVLPQSFGVVHLGETFASYVSVSNASDRVARDVAVKVELQTNRRRVALFDCGAAPLPAIQPGSSYDFIIEHDLKELGAHTLACTVEYAEDVPAGVPVDRRRHPQHFKFDVANPVAVRTKTRPGRDGATFLETCVENATKTPLLLSAATFEPAPRFTCREVLPPKSARAPTASPSPTAPTRAAASACRRSRDATCACWTRRGAPRTSSSSSGRSRAAGGARRARRAKRSKRWKKTPTRSGSSRFAGAGARARPAVCRRSRSWARRNRRNRRATSSSSSTPSRWRAWTR